MWPGSHWARRWATYAAAHRPDLVATLMATGMDIDGPAAANSAYQFGLRTARQRHNRPRHPAARSHRTAPPPQAETVRHPGPVGGQLRRSHLQRDLRHRGAGLARQPGALVRLFARRRHTHRVHGISATQAALLAELAELDLVRSLPRLDVPVVMVQGRQDQVAPGEAAQRYADSLEAPTKQLVWFEHSAHTPHLEEPEKFRGLLMRVRAASSTAI